MKRIALLLALTLLISLPGTAEGWSFGDGWEEDPAAYAGGWDAGIAPNTSDSGESWDPFPAADSAWGAPTAPEAGHTMYVVNCNEYVNLRAAPDTSSQVLAHVPLGAEVLAYGAEGQFLCVGYAGMRGYVHAGYLSDDPAPFAMRLGDDPGYAQLDATSIEAYASSEQVDQYGYYAAANANDADPSTAWAEGASGTGEGEWISLFFGEQAVAGFAIRAGYQRSADTYNACARPAGICVSVAGEPDCTVTLEDVRDEQVVLFTHPVVTDFLSIEITTVYSGASNANTCISDIRVLLAD